MDEFVALVLNEIRNGANYQDNIAHALNASSSDTEKALLVLASRGKIYLGSKDILGNYKDIAPR